jgi:hypothetical protein
VNRDAKVGVSRHDRRKWNIDHRQQGRCSISGDLHRATQQPTTMIPVSAPSAAVSAVFEPKTTIMADQ